MTCPCTGYLSIPQQSALQKRALQLPLTTHAAFFPGPSAHDAQWPHGNNLFNPMPLEIGYSQEGWLAGQQTGALSRWWSA